MQINLVNMMNMDHLSICFSCVVEWHEVAKTFVNGYI